MRHLASLIMACSACLPGAHAAPARHAPATSASVSKAIAARLPRTRISKVDCTVLPGLCEVQAGSTLFYTDPKARFLVIGHVYDLATHQDLTATRLLAINPDSMLPANSPLPAENPGHAHPSEAASAPPPQKVSLSELPASGAILWGGKGPHLTVFSDFHCTYCRMLHEDLKAMGVSVTERPISVLGTRALSEAVLCTDNPGVAVDKAYAGEVPDKRPCNVSGLDANEAFARANGFTGTPVMVRDDGAVVFGYRPRAFLEAWLEGGA